MVVNLKLLAQVPLAVLILTGCGVISVAETPAGWGSGAGKTGAEMWNEQNGGSGYPSAEGVAAYCVSIAEDGQKRFDWNYTQALAATDACTEAFVEGLS
jgi:hypothetical protein